MRGSTGCGLILIWRRWVKIDNIQNTDVTMTEEDIEYIRQMLEEDREILVKLS